MGDDELTRKLDGCEIKDEPLYRSSTERFLCSGSWESELRYAGHPRGSLSDGGALHVGHGKRPLFRGFARDRAVRRDKHWTASPLDRLGEETGRLSVALKSTLFVEMAAPRIEDGSILGAQAFSRGADVDLDPLNIGGQLKEAYP